MRFEYPIPVGTLVRMGAGSTNLMIVDSYHAGGYHGKHCMGGLHYARHERCYAPDLDDYKMWIACEKWRKP